MIDNIPPEFAIPAAVVALVAWSILELRASSRYWAARDASDPVVVTGSGHTSHRGPRSCSIGGVR